MRILVLVLTALVGCIPNAVYAQDEKPNIVWLVTEDNSKHFVKLYDSVGAAMPHIEALAKEGIVFNHAFSNAPVCSVARSTIISGCFAPRIGAQYHRRVEKVRLPDGLKMFPSYLQQAGYYTTNNAKEDYNILSGDNVWHESSNQASYKNRKGNQPFFHVQNYGITHEGKLHFTPNEMQTQPTRHSPDDIVPFPYHPNTPTVRYTYARLLDHHRIADSLMGIFIDDLRAEGLLENTIIFYYGDHGGVLPRSKGYLYESGLHVPMVVYFPEKWKHLAPVPTGTRSDAFVSFVDLAPTVLELAGISVPEQMDGSPFLGKSVTEQDWETRTTAFSYADRFDEKYEKVRAIRKGNYKYMRSYQPFYPDALYNFYRYRMLAFLEWKELWGAGRLDDEEGQFFRPKSAEMLFDLASDPHEINNLAGEEQYREVLFELRAELQAKLKALPDLSFYPESYLLDHALPVAADFGKEHQHDIGEWIDVADLVTVPFQQAKARIQNAIASSDPWKRYWAFTACSYFGGSAAAFYETAIAAAKDDSENLVRFRAAEFLALSHQPDAIAHLLQILEEAESMIEANLILNGFAHLKEQGHDLPADFNKYIDPSWKGIPKTLVEHRLDYLERP